jgi:hypothetical protein
MPPVPPAPLPPLPPLLAGLPAAARARLRPHLRRVALPQGLVLSEPGEPILDVYLLAGAVVSLLAVGAADEAVEAGLVGDGYPAALRRTFGCQTDDEARADALFRKLLG